MSIVYLVPNWFYYLAIILELLFALASAVVAYYAFKVYGISGQREGKIFGISFALISLAYFIKALINWFVLSEIGNGLRVLSLDGLSKLGIFGLYSHVILFVAGLAMLAYMTLKNKSRRVYFLILCVPLAALYIGRNEAFAFNLVSSIFLIYLCSHYYFEYKQNKNQKTLIVLCAFILLFFSGMGFVFAPNFYVNFVIGHIFELMSYVLISVSLALTMRKH